MTFRVITRTGVLVHASESAKYKRVAGDIAIEGSTFCAGGYPARQNVAEILHGYVLFDGTPADNRPVSCTKCLAHLRRRIDWIEATIRGES